MWPHASTDTSSLSLPFPSNALIHSCLSCYHKKWGVTDNTTGFVYPKCTPMDPSKQLRFDVIKLLFKTHYQWKKSGEGFMPDLVHGKEKKILRGFWVPGQRGLKQICFCVPLFFNTGMIKNPVYYSKCVLGNFVTNASILLYPTTSDILVL